MLTSRRKLHRGTLIVEHCPEDRSPTKVWKVEILDNIAVSVRLDVADRDWLLKELADEPETEET